MEMPGRSILESRAQKRAVPDYLQATPQVQATLYCETLVVMSISLDTTILNKVARTSLEVLLKDVIKIISAMLVIKKNSQKPPEIRSIDGVLEPLRLVKSHLEVASEQYKGELVAPGKITKFLAELREARKNIDLSLKGFDKNLAESTGARLSTELLTPNKG
jgi:hypothetical protein